MTDLEETWTERSFYNKPLTVWLGETEPDQQDILPLDIFTAASIGCYQRVKDIIEGDTNWCLCKNGSGWTALMYAAYYAHIDVIKLLLDFGASVHHRNNMGCNALMLAVMCGNENVVELIIKAGSILETRDNRDWTTLFHAVNSGHQNVVDVLIKYKVNLNSCERGTGLTPLMYTSQLGDVALAVSLVQAGAVVSLTNHQGHTAARIARDAGYPAVASAITQCHFQGVDGPSLQDGPAAVEARRITPQQSQIIRTRPNSAPSVDNASVQPTNLETLLNQIGLSSYMSVFQEQDVDLQIFLTLTDQDLKECGIQKLGPRRKMTSSIARWHSNAPIRSTGECAYADKLEVEMQELGVKLTEALHALHQAKTQVKQEHDLRVVTEGWVVEARGRLHQCHQCVNIISDQLVTLHSLCTSILSKQTPTSLIASPYTPTPPPPPPPTPTPTFTSTLLDTLTLLAAQVDNLVTLTDPSVPRGPSNPPSPNKQVQYSI